MTDHKNHLKLGPQEPPQDYRIWNRRQSDGTFKPLSLFFDEAVTKANSTTKRIVLIDTTQTIDPRLLRRRVILDSFDSDPLTKEQAHELLDELGEIEASLDRNPADEPKIVNGTSSAAWFDAQKEMEF